MHADTPRRGGDDDGRGGAAKGDGRGVDMACAGPRAATVTAVAMAVVAMTAVMVTTMMTAVAIATMTMPAVATMMMTAVATM